MAHQNHNDENHSHHIAPLGLYFKVWMGLIILTILTVGSSYINFGGHWNIIVAMVIATVKALLVILFFMGLKYDGLENNFAFFNAILFLAIFVTLTSTDLFFRTDFRKVWVNQGEAPPSQEVVDMNALIKPEADLLAHGKEVFTQQCITCHGSEGMGNGPAAATLNPKPRNFHVNVNWKNGRTLSAVFKTLSEGLPGTSMPSFGTLTIKDRMSLAHYVRHFMTDAPQDSAADVVALKEKAGAKASPRIPIDLAIDRIAEPEHK